MIPRVLPLVLLSRIILPEWINRWLGYVTVAVLAALLTESVAISDGHMALSPSNPALLAVVPTLFVAVKTRNLILTVACGIVAAALVRLVIG